MQKNIEKVLLILSEYGMAVSSKHSDAIIQRLAQEDVQLTDLDFYNLSYMNQVRLCRGIEFVRKSHSYNFHKFLRAFIEPGELLLGLESKLWEEEAEAFLARYFHIEPSGLDLFGDENFLEEY